MSKKPTNAELLARVAELEEENESLKNNADRVNFYAGIWPNPNYSGPKDPAWKATIRIVIPPDFYPGDPLWMDVSQWKYKKGVSPQNYKKNPPVMNMSLSPCTPDFAARKEAAHQEANPA